ncbi:MAG: hypothetical protein EBS81_08860 [Gammaproteobacteria bacterium]|nr:hypothetical protein [Gammaproteobacteria bacterium]
MLKATSSKIPSFCLAATWVIVMCMMPISSLQHFWVKAVASRVVSTSTMRLIHHMPTSCILFWIAQVFLLKSLLTVLAHLRKSDMKVRRILGRAAVMVVGLAGVSLSIAQPFEPLKVPSPLGEVVRNLDVDERGPDGSTPLQWAVYDQDVEKVRTLIRAGADVNAANNYGANAMQLAAEVGHVELLDMLLDAGADVDSPNPEGQTALMLVARTGNLDAARLLVRKGATIDTPEGWGQQTALMWASARRHPAMMELLIREGADVNAISAVRDYNSHVTAEGRAKRLDSGGLTPLMYAVRENCLACVEVLLENDVDLDLTDPDGVSPLLLSVLNANWDIAKRLIEAGADVNQWDMFGQSPLIASAGNRNDPGLKVDGLIIRLLLEYGAKADLPQADLQTPVSALAGARGNRSRLPEGLELLLEAGVDVNVMSVPHHLQRAFGGTPLHYAVKARNTNMVEALVNAGADINAKDVDGLTALDYAESRSRIGFTASRQPPNNVMAELLRSLGATEELDATPFWPNVGPPFFYPWHVFPLDPESELNALVPGSFDHQ